MHKVNDKKVLFIALSALFMLPAIAETMNDDLLFVSERDGDKDIYRFTDDGKQLRVTNNSVESMEPSWSPDGQRIAFTQIENGNPDIYIIDKDGSNLRRLTTNPGLDSAPVWTSEGTHVVFESDQKGISSLYSASIKTGELQPLTQSKADSQPHFSSDGRRLAFVRLDGRSKNLFIKDLETNEEVQISKGKKYNDGSISWAPDSQSLVYTTSRDKKFSIRVIDANGLNEKLLMEGNDNASGTCWSPDGERLAFVSVLQGKVARSLFVIDKDGNNLKQIGPDNFDSSQPSWSQDSQTIAFIGYQGRKNLLFSINADGSKMTQLTEDNITVNYPQFAPSSNLLSHDHAKKMEFTHR